MQVSLITPVQVTTKAAEVAVQVPAAMLVSRIEVIDISNEEEFESLLFWLR